MKAYKKDSQRKMIDVIESTWALSPELRFNQLIHHLQQSFNEYHGYEYEDCVYVKETVDDMTIYSERYCVDLFHVHDEEFLKFLEYYLERNTEFQRENKAQDGIF